MNLKHASRCRLVNSIANEVIPISLNVHGGSEGDILILVNSIANKI